MRAPRTNNPQSTEALEELRSRVIELEAAKQEWEQTATSLLRSEERFRTVFDHSNDAIFIVDPDRDQIIDANSKACEMLGYSLEELLSLPMSAIHPDEMPKVKALAERVCREGVAWTNELTCMTRSEHRLASEISASLVDVNGRPCLIAMIRDISKRKRAENELRKVNTRMKAELEAAAEIQRSLLPSHSPVRGKVKVAWKVRPCEELRGDTLNVFPLDSDHLGLYVLDVSGHGAAAAMLSVALHRLLTPVVGPTSLLTRPLLRQPQDDESMYEIASPAWVCMQLNTRFPMDPHAGIPQYFTLIYGVLNTESGHFRYAVAGHPPPVYVPSEGRAMEIGEYGFPIGFFGDVRYEEQFITAEAGTRLYLYSDGLSDAVNLHGEPFGRDRIKQTAEKSRDRPLHNAVSHLFDRVEVWSGGNKLEDDASVLAVEVR